MTRNKPHFGPGVHATQEQAGYGQISAITTPDQAQKAFDPSQEPGPSSDTSDTQQNATSGPPSQGGEQQQPTPAPGKGSPETLYTSYIEQRQGCGFEAPKSSSNEKAFKSHFNDTTNTTTAAAQSRPQDSPPKSQNQARRKVPGSGEMQPSRPLNRLGRLDAPVAAKNPQVKAGNFHASSRNMRLEAGRYLVADCADRRGNHHESMIDLNDCLTNTMGKVLWARGGNFRASARNVKLEENGAVLVCEAGNGSGGWTKSTVRLGERITNENGVLKMS
ncbi:hypothetical protein MBLNU230_g1091t1 [Neophaeotheca triangularis]